MTILQNNLTTQETILRKVKALRTADKKIELAKELNAIVTKLKENRAFINGHNDKKEQLKDISIVLLNSEYICPVYTKSKYCSLNPIHIDDELEDIILSTRSVGGDISGDDIRGYRDKKNSTVEEINIDTFNAFEYFDILNKY